MALRTAAAGEAATSLRKAEEEIASLQKASEAAALRKAEEEAASS